MRAKRHAVRWCSRLTIAEVGLRLPTPFSFRCGHATSTSHRIKFMYNIQGKRAVGSAQLIVPAMFHGSTSCGIGGLTTYEFSTQPNRVVSHNGIPALRLHNTNRRAHSLTTSVLPNTVNPIV